MTDVSITDHEKLVLVLKNYGGHQPTTMLQPAATTEQHLIDEFQDGKLYGFRSVTDDQWLENDNSSCTDGNMIHTNKGSSACGQYFYVYADDTDNNPPLGYRIQTACGTDSRYVLTVSNKFQNHRVILKPYNGERDQFWHLIKVHGTQNYQIVNSQYGKALSNNGTPVNCRAIDADPNDLHQQWTPEEFKNVGQNTTLPNN